jgi:hypothetical protein
MATIKAMYGCQSCGLDKVKVELEGRSADESIEQFVDRFAHYAGSDHLVRSPICNAGKVDLYMPVTKNGIGFAGEPLTSQEMADMAARHNIPKAH